MTRFGRRLVLFVCVCAGALALAPAGSAFIYWSDPAAGTIGRVAPDGSQLQASFISGLAHGSGQGPTFIAVSGQYVYWTNPNIGAIGRANVDGSGVNEHFISGLSQPWGVAVDGSHIFWTDRSRDSIGRANLDGSGVDQDFITNANSSNAGLSDPVGLAVQGGFLYWTDAVAGTIGRARVDGSDADGSFVSLPAFDTPGGLAADGSHLFFTNTDQFYGTHTIGRVSLDGSGLDVSFVPLAGDGSGQVDETPDGLLVWANGVGHAIGAANSDGSAPSSTRIPLGSGSAPLGVASDHPAPSAASGARVMVCTPTPQRRADGTVGRFFDVTVADWLGGRDNPSSPLYRSVPAIYVQGYGTMCDPSDLVAYGADPHAYCDTAFLVNESGQPAPAGVSPSDWGALYEAYAPRTELSGLLGVCPLSYMYFTSIAHGVGSIGTTRLGLSQPDLITGLATDGVTIGPRFLASDGRYLYWTNPVLGAIGRATLGGGSVDERFIGGLRWPTGIAVGGGYLYWTSAEGIGRARLDGSDVNASFIPLSSNPFAVTVAGGHIFWSDPTLGAIGRANLDGSAVQTQFIKTGDPAGLASDGSFLYWIRCDNDTTLGMSRARIDGGGLVESFMSASTLGPIACGQLTVAPSVSQLYWVEIASSNTGGPGQVDTASLDGKTVTRGVASVVDRSVWGAVVVVASLSGS